MTDETLSEAIKEAYAVAPSDEIIFHTLEFYHPAFTVPIRVVRDNTNLVARLESDAPRAPGQSVTFLAFAFDLQPPEVKSDGLPVCVIEIDNVDQSILYSIEQSMGSTELISVIYRAYLSGNADVGPENDPPLTLTVQTISADAFKIRATAGFPDLVNKKFPNLSYDSEIFPGLIAQ